MALLGQVLRGKRAPHGASGQNFGARTSSTAKNQKQWDGTLLGVPALPVPSQGMEQHRGHLGVLGISMGLEMG